MLSFKAGIEGFPEAGDFQCKAGEVLGKLGGVGCPALRKTQPKTSSLKAPKMGKDHFPPVTGRLLLSGGLKALISSLP